MYNIQFMQFQKYKYNKFITKLNFFLISLVLKEEFFNIFFISLQQLLISISEINKIYLKIMLH
jgi:hypothetical protein